MKQSNRIIMLMFVTALGILSASAQSGGQQTPIDLGIKSGQGAGTQSPSTSTVTLSACYTSDSLYVSFSGYTGMAAVIVRNAVTGHAEIQTLQAVNISASIVAIDISGLMNGYYTLTIVLNNDEEWEGLFYIDSSRLYCCQKHRNMPISSPFSDTNLVTMRPATLSKYPEFAYISE